MRKYERHWIPQRNVGGEEAEHLLIRSEGNIVLRPSAFSFRVSYSHIAVTLVQGTLSRHLILLHLLSYHKC